MLKADRLALRNAGLRKKQRDYIENFVLEKFQKYADDIIRTQAQITSEKLNTAREQGKIQIPEWEIAIKAILESQEEMLNELFEDAPCGKF